MVARSPSELAAVLRTPLDATLFELPEEQRRTLVRLIADEVGRRVARRVQQAQADGAPLSVEAEKVASVTAIHRELVAFNESRVRGGLPPWSEGGREAMVDAVMAHIYGLGELDALWVAADVENIDVNGPDRVFVSFVGGQRVPWSPIARDEDELVELIRRAA